MAMDIHVYMLRCADGSYYVGSTRVGIDRRLAEHNAGIFQGYTSSRLPVSLVWSESFRFVTDAIQCERRLKGWRREKKEALIRGDFSTLKSLARTAKPSNPSQS
jgi:putative endonuclease